MQIIKDTGSWTLTSGESGTWNADGWKLQDAIVAANLLGLSPFFLFAVGTDDKNSDMQLIVVCLHTEKP